MATGTDLIVSDVLGLSRHLRRSRRSYPPRKPRGAAPPRTCVERDAAVGEAAGRHDHAREPRARWRVGAEVRWEEGGVELLARGAYRNGDDVGALRRNHSGVEHAEAARPCELQVQRAIRKVVVEVLPGTGVEHIGGLRDGLSVLEGHFRV